MHSSDQVHALSIDLCKNRYRKTAATCACSFGQVRALSPGGAGTRGLPPGGSGGRSGLVSGGLSPEGAAF